MEPARSKPMKTALPWCVALALLAGLFALQTRTRSKESELARLRQENEQVTALRAENEVLKKIPVQEEELARLRKENEELHRLRNEVHQLRAEKQQTAASKPAAQPPTAPARADAAAQQQQQLQQLLAENERLRAENQLAQATGVENQVNVCINNLRQIDSAKQQWALENKKGVDAIPTAQEILPYLKDQIFPVCPSGRAYAINAVGLVPTCSIPGHALAQP